MPQAIDAQTKQLFLSAFFRPAITTWNRLEARPRSEDFERTLKAEVRDPLWMLCRQWQLGEFRGEDAGSAVKAKVQVATARINRYAGRNGRAVAYEHEAPLETRVEREPINLDLMTRAQMGRHWLKLVRPLGDLEDDYVAEYGFLDPESGSEEEAQLRADRNASQIFAALSGRVVDGARLLEAFESTEHETWLASVVPDDAARQAVLAAAAQFREWLGRVYSQPGSSEDPAWAEEYLEYQFACAAPADEEGGEQTVLVADQYHHGHLDWYAFDIDPDPMARLVDEQGAAIPPGGLELEEPMSFVLNPVEFAGMPNVRWWEFEDRRTDFGDLRASTSDLATLMLAEFGLIYGNDWSVVPYELEIGTLTQVLGVVVTDVFGVRTLVRAAADTANGARERWSLFNLHTRAPDRVDTRLFLPPVVARTLEGAPNEQVLLVRDEMANMVWGIEQTIPGVAGGGVDGHEAATDLDAYFRTQAEPAEISERLDTGAAIRYQLGTRVPENWIPFVAVHRPGSNRDIRLQRAAMPRLIPGTATKPVEPRGVTLRPGLDQDPQDSYFLVEEVVTRSGVAVTRSFQRARWWDGRIYTWLGRKKETRRARGSSGLEFDRIVPTDE